MSSVRPGPYSPASRSTTAGSGCACSQRSASSKAALVAVIGAGGVSSSTQPSPCSPYTALEETNSTRPSAPVSSRAMSPRRPSTYSAR